LLYRAGFDVELKHGLDFIASPVPSARSVGFIRTINDLETQETPSQVSDFIDVFHKSNRLSPTQTSEVMVDDDAQDKIRLIREVRPIAENAISALMFLVSCSYTHV